MTLTEVQKRKIEEEERFREKVRKDVNKTPWWKPKGFGAWIIVLIFLAVLAFSLTSKSSTPTNNPLPAQEKTIDENTSYTSKTENGKTTYAILFKSPLARDDQVIGENIGRIIRNIYGENSVSNVLPKIVERNGTNLVSLDSTDGGSFLILLLKNDNGTVYGMSLWKE